MRFRPAQTMVEFALVVSIFLLLLFALLQLSLALLTYNSVSFAAARQRATEWCTDQTAQVLPAV